ncbi:MAG TPA: hypothetical protein VGN63_03270 [Flavisolibacter sp.]|nr:hypothetical protein [Flavisolibacter sp.]
MRGKLLFTFLLFFSLTCFSQDSIFRLKDYKYRTEGYKALALDLQLSGSQSESKAGTDPKTIGSNFQLAPSNISYYKIISKEDRWHESEISLHSQYNFSKSSSQVFRYKEKQFNGYLTWRRTDRFYKKNNTYLEIGNELQGTLSSHKNEGESIFRKQSENKASDIITLGIGKGRIEFVQDAQMAVFILEDLQRQGLLQRAVDAETYIEFARIITDMNNRRLFDFRRRRIYELSRIVSFLRDKGLVTTPDIRSFVTVNDNWSLAFNPPRNSGTIYFVKLKPSFQWGNDIRKSNDPPIAWESEIDRRSVGLSPVIGFETYKPTSLKWQRNAGVAVSYERFWNWSNYRYKSDTGNSESDNSSTNGFYALNAFYGIGFYPNNRTVLNASASLAANYYTRNYWTLNPQFLFSTSYFLGYRTRLTADVSYRLNRNSMENSLGTVLTDHQTTAYFNLGLSHFIF